MTSAWMRLRLQAVATGMDRHQAALYADTVSGIPPKERGRIRLAGGITLSIPVEGGSHALRRNDTDPVLSEHGKWRREHLGAFATVYGRTPYFIHLMPQIEEVYANSEGLRLSEFKMRLLGIADKWIDPEVEFPKRLQEAAREISLLIDDNISIFDALFRLGKRCSLGWGYIKN